MLGENNQMLDVFAAQRLRGDPLARGRRLPRVVPDRGDRRARAGGHDRRERQRRRRERPRRPRAALGRRGRRLARARDDRRRAASRTSRARLPRADLSGQPGGARRSQGLRGLSQRRRDRAAGRSRGRSPCPPRAVEDVVAECARGRRARRRRDLVGLRRGVGRGARRAAAARDLVRGSGMRMVGPELHGRAQHRSRRVAERDLRADLAAARATSACSRRAARSGSPILDYVAHAQHRHLDASSRSATRPTSRATTCSVYWADDPRTRVIVLYLESFGNPRKFARIAPEVARRQADRRGQVGSLGGRHARGLEPLGGAGEPRRRRRRALRAGGRHPHRHAGGALRRRGAARDAAGPRRPARRRRHQRGRSRASSSPTPARRTASRCRQLRRRDARRAARASCRPQAGRRRTRST